jgi:putative transposase
MVLLSALFLLIRGLILPRTSLAAENLALRQQLAILNRKFHRPQLHRQDRFFWVILSQLWKNWREVLIIVKPETVIRWHRQGFKLYWRWKSKAPVGRPKIDKEIRELIKRMSFENPLGNAADTIGTSPSRVRPCGIDCGEVSSQGQRVSVTDLEDILANHASPQVGGLHHSYRRVA